MVGKPLDQAVRDAFDAETRGEFGEKYLELLYSTWSDAVRTLRRTVLLCVAAALSFFLLDDQKNAELSLGILTTSNISAVLILIPAITSFFLFEAIDLTVANRYYKDTASALMKKLHPSVYENNLELLLEPTTSFAWGIGSLSSLTPRSEGKLETVREWIEISVVFGTVLTMLAFLTYAYVRLYGNSHADVIAVSVSLLFTLFNVARGGVQLADV